MRGWYCCKWCTVVWFFTFQLKRAFLFNAEYLKLLICWGCRVHYSWLQSHKNSATWSFAALAVRWLCGVEIWTGESACPLSKLPSLVCGSTFVTGPESQQCHFHSHFHFLTLEATQFKSVHSPTGSLLISLRSLVCLSLNEPVSIRISECLSLLIKVSIHVFESN